MDKKDQFDKWVDQWQKAQDEGIFGQPQEAETPTGFGTDFFGNYKPKDSNPTPLKDVDAKYWNQVYQMSAHPGCAPDVTEVLTEELNDEEDCDCPCAKPDGKSVAKITDELGKLPNPVKSYTRGKDQDLHVTPNWSCGEDLVELHNMKIKLQKLEDKLAADPMMEQKKTKSILTQINSLKEKIDELSDSLSPEFRTDYLS